MLIKVTKEVADYISRYGGRCRDCADRDGICHSGLPCADPARRDAIHNVLAALNYGVEHGYIKAQG